MKKILSFILAASVIVACFAGCNLNKEATEENQSETNIKSSTTETKSQEPLEIKWLAYNQPSGILANPDSETKKLIEEKFNVRLSIETVDLHNTEQFNLYWASGNIPDHATTNKSSSITMKFVDQGIVREIPDGYLDKHMPDWMNTIYSFMTKEQVIPQISKGGKTYIIPYASQALPGVMSVRQDWLDNVGIKELPKTLDDFTEMLKKFTFNDPDKDGKDNTFGMHDLWFLPSYFETNKNQYRKADDGKLVNSSTTEGYKEMLKYLNSLFKQGVIDPEFATDDRTIQRKKWAEGRFGVLTDSPWWYAASTPGNLTDMMKTADANAKLVFLEPLMGPDGKQNVNYSIQNCVGDGSSFFGKNCSDEKMIKVMEIRNEFKKDWGFYEQVYYGKEGRDFTKVSGIIIPNKDATTTEYVTEKGIRQTYALAPITGDDETKHLLVESDAKLYSFARGFDKFWIGNVLFSDISKAEGTYGADVSTAIDEFYFNAITGKVNVDTEWDKYIDKLNSLGLDKILAEKESLVVK